MFLLATPLEQFQILPLFSISFLFSDLTLSNSTIIFGFALIFPVFLLHLLSSTYSFDFLPKIFQFLLETFYLLVFNLLQDNVGSKGNSFFPYIFSFFILILTANLSGLVSYSFTITSHLVITFSFALAIFGAITFLCFQEHNLNFFSLFLPAGSSIFLALLLTPIEIVSYIFRPISLAVRLFANMMAGHTLLKVIVGFAWTMMLSSSGLVCIAHIVPLAVLVLLMFLELGVAMIQSYVFTILACIYLNDSLNLH